MKQSAGAQQRGVQLRGNWLLFARLSWEIVALFSLSYFLFSFDARFSATFAYRGGVFAPQGFVNTLLTVDRSILWILCPVLWCAIGAFLCRQFSRKRKSPGDFMFPDGRFAPRWMSVPIITFLLLAFCVNFFDVPLLTPWFIGFGSPLSILVNVLGLTSLLYKYRRVSTPQQRRQTRWAVLGLLVFWGTNLASQLMYRAFGMTLFTTLLQLTLYAVTLLFLPLAFSLALLRDRLWEITPLIRRTLAYGLMTAGLFVAYIVIVLLVRLQRAINRLFYGERDDPYAVIARLGQRIEAVVVPRDVLPGIVETVAQALKLPYVAIALKDGQTFSTAAAYGRQDEQSPLTQVPLLSQHEQIGVLVCHPRHPVDHRSPRFPRAIGLGQGGRAPQVAPRSP